MNRQRRVVYSALALMALLALVAASTRAERPRTLVVGIHRASHPNHGPLPPNPKPLPPWHQRAAKPHRKRERSGSNWLTIALLGAIGLGGTALCVALARQRREDPEPEVTLSAALDDLLLDTLEDLRAERDARRAVIRAYARMERLFSAYGFPRKDSEAPLEYLARLLGSLDVSALSVQRLTQLFHRARFSTHEIDLAMKDAAIEALEGLRAQLQPLRQEAA